MQQFFGAKMNGTVIEKLAFFGAEFLVVAVILLLLRKLAFSTLHRWAKRTDTNADDFILESIKYPSMFWAIALAIYITIATSGLPAEYVNYGLKALYILIVLSVTLAAANVISKLVEAAIQKSSAGVAVTGLSRAVIRAIVFAVGVLIILNGLGISITPILTALGVGGLAVALALQDTLSNLFAGMHLLMERPIKVGDYIKMNTGEEGHVLDIGWRTTRIKQLSNNIIIIPNNKLSQTIITNFSLPENRLGVSIKVSVSCSSDPDKVEEVLIDLATGAVGQVKGLLAEPPPSVKLIPGFGDFSIDFSLGCSVAEYADQFDVQHELRKKIIKRFRQEGIEFPFPTRTVYIRQ